MASPKAFSKYINESRIQKPNVLMEQVSCEVVGFERRDFCPVSLLGFRERSLPDVSNEVPTCWVVELWDDER